MRHVSALDQVMKTLTQEARASLSNATPQPEAEGEIVIRRRDGTHISGRYMATTNVIPGVHVSVMAKI
jgi:hypothetical protein